MITLINKLEQEGTLKLLFNSGFVSWKTLFYRDIYLQYDIYIKKGSSRACARSQAAQDFKIDESTVFRAVKKMEG